MCKRWIGGGGSGNNTIYNSVKIKIPIALSQEQILETIDFGRPSSELLFFFSLIRYCAMAKNIAANFLIKLSAG